MAKLTVYVPDDLLERARGLDPGANTSQLVQRGLERLAPADDVRYARRPAEAESLLAQAAEKLRAGAAEEYESGYRTALVTVATVGESFFYQLDDLARMGFDMPRWLREWGQRAADGIYPSPAKCHEALAKDLGGPFVDNHEAPYFIPTRAFIKGYGDALREAWEAAERQAGQNPAGYIPDAEDEKEVARET